MGSGSRPGAPGAAGCIALMRAADASLGNLTFAGCLLERNATLGTIDADTLAWRAVPEPASMIECPDVFFLQGALVALGSFNGVTGGGAGGSAYFVGRLSEGLTLRPGGEPPALLDYGQYYAAKTGVSANLQKKEKERK